MLRQEKGPTGLWLQVHNNDFHLTIKIIDLKNLEGQAQIQTYNLTYKALYVLIHRTAIANLFKYLTTITHSKAFKSNPISSRTHTNYERFASNRSHPLRQDLLVC